MEEKGKGEEDNLKQLEHGIRKHFKQNHFYNASKKKKGNNEPNVGERGANDRTVSTSRVGRKLKKKRLSFPPGK